MAVAQTRCLVQSEQPSTPYLSVGTDERGSVCWEVVGTDLRICCCSGHRAMEVLRAVCRSKGFTLPR